MLNLLKYEFYRRQKILLISAIVLLAIQGGILFGINKGEGYLALAAALSLLMIYGTLLLLLVDTIRNYSTDLNRKEGYMLFLTPNNGHKIIVSKVLTTTILLVLSGTIVFLLTRLNLGMVKNLYIDTLQGELKLYLDALVGIYQDAIPSLGSFALIVSELAVEFIAFVVAVLFSITVRKTLLSHAKYGGILSFIIFAVVFSIMQSVNFGASLITGSFGHYMDMVNDMTASESFDRSQFSILINQMLGVEFAMNFIYIAVFTFLSGKLLTKHVDL